MADFTFTVDETKVIAALDAIEKKFASAGAAADASGKKVGAAFHESVGSIDEMTAALAKNKEALAQVVAAENAGSKSTAGMRAALEQMVATQEKAIASKNGLANATVKETSDTKLASASLAAYNAAQDKLKAGAQDRIAANAKMRAGLEQFRKEQEVLNAATDEGAKKTVDLAEATNTGANATKSAEGATKGATIAQRAWNSVMSLNPIGLIIAAIVLLVIQLRKYQGVIDAASKITSQIGAVFTVVTDRAISLGKAIYALVTLDFASFGQNMVKATDDFTGAVSNAWTQAGNLADATVALRNAQLEAALSTAKLQAASERYQAIAGDETKNYNERIKALKSVIGLESEIAKVKLGFAAQDLANAKQQFALSGALTGSVGKRELLLEKELAYQDAKSASDKTRIQFLTQLNKLEKERLEFIAKSIEDSQKLQDKLNIDLAGDATDKEILTIQKNVEDKIAAITKGIAQIDAVETLRPLNDKEIKLRQDLSDSIVRVIKDGDKKITDVLLKSLFDSLEIEDKIEKAKKDAAKKQGDEARAALKDLLELELQKIAITKAASDNFIDVLKAQGAEESAVKKAQFEFDQNIKGLTIQANLDFERAMLALAGEGTEADIIRARIRELETLLQGIDIPAPKGKDGGPVNLFDLLGIKLPPGAEDEIRESIGKIIDSIGELMQARVDEAQAAADAAQTKVDAAQDLFDKENDLAKQGLANNSDFAKKALDEAKKVRDSALKEEEKAKKAQIAIDSAVQLSALITTAANIFKGFSKLPIVGQVLGVISVAAMFASFAAAKAKALKAAEAPKLRKGDKIVGRTHEQGGELRELEHGEQVVGAGESVGQDVFFQRMRKGQYKGIDLAAMAENKGDYQPMSGAAARTTALQQRRDKATEQMHYNVLSRTYERVGGQIVDAIKSKPSYAPWGKGYKRIKETGHGTDTTTYQPSE